VHLAPAFGADDYAAGQRHGLPLMRPIDDEGKFLESIPEIGGKFVKDADAPILEILKQRGMLFRTETYRHSYPHCWRCESPLIYMARDSWFAATSTLKDQMLANNAKVQWHPPEVGEGRFGEWLRGNVDWALSRDRYWGTPLPVWLCDGCDEPEWIGSLAELEERVGALPDDFDLHRPFIDRLTWACSCGGTRTRTPGVLDVWFDSGAMPYAQWHYPFENVDQFEAHYPADYICEAMDQTRGWFYSLLAIATLLGRGTPYRNVVVNGLILDSDGLKMSKSRGNAADPWEAVESFGADGLRWYLMTVSLPWADKKYDPQAVGEASRRFFDTLFNTYRFLTLYAGAEGWTASEDDPALEDRPLMDRWLAGRLDTLVRGVNAGLNEYRITPTYRAVQTFVDEDLSNWYVRRSRSRFWNSGDVDDQRAAFRTLWDALRTVALLIAPVAPFVSDWMHRALAQDSAHLTPFPQPAPEPLADGAVDAEMDAVRALSRLGRAAREEVKIRVRQPLRTLQAVTPGGVRPRPELLDVLADELNVKEVAFLGTADGLVTVQARPNYRALGPRYQKRTEAAAAAIRALSVDDLRAYARGETVEIEVDGASAALHAGDVDVVEEADGGLAVHSAGGYTAALDPELDEELAQEGLARELVNRIQRLRRDAEFDISDRIHVALGGPDDVRLAAQAHKTFIMGEILALSLVLDGSASPASALERELDIDGRTVTLAVWRAKA